MFGWSKPRNTIKSKQTELSATSAARDSSKPFALEKDWRLKNDLTALPLAFAVPDIFYENSIRWGKTLNESELVWHFVWQECGKTSLWVHCDRSLLSILYIIKITSILRLCVLLFVARGCLWLRCGFGCGCVWLQDTGMAGESRSCRLGPAVCLFIV